MTNSIGQILLYESLGLSHLLEARKVHIVGQDTASEGIRGEPGTGRGGKKGKFATSSPSSRGVKKGYRRDWDYDASSRRQDIREWEKLRRLNPKVHPKGWQIRALRDLKKTNPPLDFIYPFPEENKKGSKK